MKKLALLNMFLIVIIFIIPENKPIKHNTNRSGTTSLVEDTIANGSYETESLEALYLLSKDK